MHCATQSHRARRDARRAAGLLYESAGMRAAREALKRGPLTHERTGWRDADGKLHEFSVIYALTRRGLVLRTENGAIVEASRP